VTPRFFAPSIVGSVERVELPSDEAHHLLHVLRLGPGARVRVFDGRGREWEARVASVTDGAVRLDIGPPVPPAPEPPVKTTLALGVLKGASMDHVVRDAAMVGVATIQPLATARMAAASEGARSARAVARWQRIAVAAVKQCGRAVVPEVRGVGELGGWLTATRSDPAAKIVLVEPGLETGTPPALEGLRVRARSHGAVLLSGPEGGWAPEELATARQAGFEPWTVTPRILRADAVPVAALSVLFYLWERG
jgi:16S rRNA (uracil1498-N3)-methyltransferase